MKRTRRSPESFRYVLPSDRDLPRDQQSVFICKPLTLAERIRALDELTVVQIMPDGSRFEMSRDYQQCFEFALSHLEAVENFPSDDPQEWPVKASRVERERFLDQLDETSIYLIGNEIRVHAVLGEPEKNSSTPTRTRSSDAPSVAKEASPSMTAEPAIAIPG